MERHEVIQIRVSPKEKADIITKSGSIGMSISEFLRKLVMEWKK